MDFQEQIRQLSATVKILPLLLDNIPVLQARWKPLPDKWSLLEVLNHMLDEEVRDFRNRLDLTLHHPGKEWPAIDPVQWASTNRYNDRDLQQSLVSFTQERDKSVAWLKDLIKPDWEKTYNHSKFGPIRAGDLMVSWVAHDQIHLRQMINLKIMYLEKTSEPYSTSYALP